jgi:hypothetical protein
MLVVELGLSIILKMATMMVAFKWETPFVALYQTVRDKYK